MKLFLAPAMADATRILGECALPVSDLTEQHREHFFGCGSPDHLEGIVGLEPLGSIGLLRSLAVLESARGSGCGQALVARIEQHAQELGLQELYLLTNTAARFFETLGYEQAGRESAPEALRQTTEFSSICPASATLMRKALNTPSAAPC
ncbi:MAG: arsenic resistance N-acetyltransferase ArsN2 [Rhabdaerophilum sp.]